MEYGLFRNLLVGGGYWVSSDVWKFDVAERDGGTSTQRLFQGLLSVWIVKLEGFKLFPAHTFGISYSAGFMNEFADFIVFDMFGKHHLIFKTAH